MCTLGQLEESKQWRWRVSSSSSAGLRFAHPRRDALVKGAANWSSLEPAQHIVCCHALASSWRVSRKLSRLRHRQRLQTTPGSQRAAPSTQFYRRRRSQNRRSSWSTNWFFYFENGISVVVFTLPFAKWGSSVILQRAIKIFADL